MSRSFVSLAGLPELQNRLRDVTETLTGDDAAAVMGKTAKAVRDDARRRAPIGEHATFTRLLGGNRKRLYQRKATYQPGKLRDAIISWQRRRSSVRAVYGDNQPAAYVKVSYSPRMKAYAPHAHFTEFGTKDRTPKGKRLLSWPSPDGNGWIFARRTRGTPERPYFRPAIAAAGPALDQAVSDLQGLIR